MYNLTNVTQSVNIYEQFKAINMLSNGLLVALLLFALFVILIVTFYHFGLGASFMGSSFICLVFGTITLYLDFIGWHVLIFFVISFFAGIIMLKFL